MDLLMKKKFDFSSFAFKEEGDLNESTELKLPPKIERKQELAIESDEEEDSKSNECFKTRSGRTVQLKNNPKTFVLSETSSDEDDDENVSFKLSNKLDNQLNGKSKRKRKQKATIEDNLDITTDFKPLKKSNRSIQINQEPLKALNNKLSKIEIDEKKKNLSLPDEINLLLEDDGNSNSSFAKVLSKDKKRKINNFSDEDSDSNIAPAKKRTKKKKVIYSDDESQQTAASEVQSINDNKDDCPDDIQVILDEENQSDDDYESDEDLLSSSSDENEEEDEKVPKKGKSRKLELRKALVNLCNEGKEAELLSITGMNRKIYDELVLLREFRDWSDLMYKLERSTSISTDIIEPLSDFIKTKSVITNIMDKCQDLSNKIKASVKNLKEQNTPRCLNKKLKLKPYQLVGLNYLVMMFKQKLNSVLADEMGLGKTIQVIALLAYLREDCNIYGPHLIVVPSSILANWEREFELWCPKINILRYYGNQDERAQLRYEITSKTVPYDVILTTYNMLYSGDDKKLLTRVKFQYSVFDEAHMLKNMKSSRFKNLFAVKAKYRLMLTGTPIQNNLLELISLLTFTVPSLFYSKLTFMENFFKNKKFDDNQSQFVQEKTDQAKEILKPFILRRIKENVLKELPSKVERYVELNMTDDQARLYDKIVAKYSEQLKVRKERKKREKKERYEEKIEIIEDRNRRRPKKTDYNEDNLFYVEELDRKRGKNKKESVKEEVTVLDDDESKDNESKVLNGDATTSTTKKVFNLGTKLDELIEINSESSSSDIWCIDGKENDDKAIKDRQGSILMELRKCANHPLLIRNLYTNELLLKMAQLLKKKEPYYQKDGNIKYMIEDMELLNDFDLHMLCKRFACINEFQLKDKQILHSSKFNYLDSALTEFKAKNQKVLIFSQFVMMLDIIEEFLKIKSIKYCRLDGSTKVIERMSRIDSFKDKEIFVFLLTTKAGGIGINLVEANQVIMHDSDFNPYNDLQAQARAHRIGQTQEVNVYKLISERTVEIYMRQICEEKLRVGKKITSDEVEQRNEESSDVKKLLKKALNI